MRIASIVLAAVLFPSQAIAGASTPDELAREFYSRVLSQPGLGTGLPIAREKERLTELFSPVLIQLLEAAIAMEKRCTEANAPGNKLYTIEDNILAGNYEGATIENDNATLTTWLSKRQKRTASFTERDEGILSRTAS